MPSGLVIWPESPGLSLLTVLLTVVLVLYAARVPAHRAIRGVAEATDQACRLTSKALALVGERLAARNRAVLLRDGLEETERQIEQELQRIGVAVARDVGAYPALHRELIDQIRRIDDDYRRSADTPPVPEAWAQTMEAATELARRTGSQVPVAKAVDALRAAMRAAHDDAMEAYRAAGKERHKALSTMVPLWRSMEATLGRVERARRHGGVPRLHA
jgi:hypothetical protein